MLRVRIFLYNVVYPHTMIIKPHSRSTWAPISLVTREDKKKSALFFCFFAWPGYEARHLYTRYGCPSMDSELYNKDISAT